MQKSKMKLLLYLREVERLELVAGTKLIHRHLNLAAIKVQGGAASATAAPQTAKKNRLIAEKKESRVAAVPTDNQLSKRSANSISRNRRPNIPNGFRHLTPFSVPSSLTPVADKTVGRDCIQLRQKSLFLLVEGYDRESVSIAERSSKINRQYLRRPDIWRQICIKKAHGDVSVTDPLCRLNMTGTDLSILTDEADADTLPQRKMICKHNVTLADGRSSTKHPRCVVPRANTGKVNSPQPEIRVQLKWLLEQATRETKSATTRWIIDKTTDTQFRICRCNPLVN